MPTDTPREAFEHFLAPMQRAVSLVVPSGRGVLTFGPRPLRLGVVHSIAFANGQPVRLAGDSLFFECFCDVQIVGSATNRGTYDIATKRYSYTLLDQARRELIVYHYHPASEGWCTYPHLHVGTATGVISNKTHLATGWVSLQAVIRMLIEDPSIPVAPLRPDWAQVLDTSQRTFD